MDDLYLERPNLYIGFHGCEKENGLKLVNEPRDIISSKADHEWLGKGFYVWENNQDRVWDWAKKTQTRTVQTSFCYRGRLYSRHLS